VALPVHALRAVQVRLTSISYEGHFTPEPESVSRPYLPPHCSGANEECHIAIPAILPKAVEDRLKSIVNEGHFTHEAETILCLCLPQH
jgi:hypothetical protein